MKPLCLALTLLLCLISIFPCTAEIALSASSFWPDELPHLTQNVDEAHISLCAIDPSAEDGCLLTYALSAAALPQFESYLLALADDPFMQIVFVDNCSIQFLYTDAKLGAPSEKQLSVILTLAEGMTEESLTLTVWFREEIVAVTRYTACHTCKQRGTVVCTRCSGSGIMLLAGTQSTCYYCDGKGTSVCIDCNGEGLIPY